MDTHEKKSAVISLINLDFSNRMPTKLILKHALYFLIWLLFWGVLVLRIDTVVISKYSRSSNTVGVLIPVIFIALILFIVLRQKWYNNLAMAIYPLLIIFWFLPKMILKLGKFYALLYYMDFLFQRFRHFKRTIISTFVAIICLLLFLVLNNDVVRIVMMLLCSYLFIKFLVKYFKNSFQPAKLFGITFGENLNQISARPTKLIDTIENVKDDDKLDSESKRLKRLERLIMVNTFLAHLTDRLVNFRGRKAYILFAIIQLAFYVIVAVLFFSFLNFELFKIDPKSFSLTIVPNFFDFFYYAIKNVTCSNPDNLKPVSLIAKSIEVWGFAVFSVFFFIIAVSHLISLRSQKIDQGLKIIAQNCEAQIFSIQEHVKATYQVEISQAVEEISSIKKSMEKLRRIIDQIM